MDNCEPLAWYGTAVIILTACMVLIPYIRGKRELVSAWNLLLAGIGNFVGLGCIEAATSPMRFPGLQWFTPTPKEVQWYMLATTAFLIALFATHYFDPISKALAKKTFVHWPPISTKVFVFVVLFCLPLTVAPFVPGLSNIVFVRPVLINVSHKAIVFACVFSFLLWYRSRTNLVWLGQFIGVCLGMALVAMLVSPGRRLLLSVISGPVFAFYFCTARHWRPTKALTVLGIAIAALFFVSLVYSTFRRFDKREPSAERTPAQLVQQLLEFDRKSVERFTNDMLWYFSQHVVHYALLVDRFVQTGQLEPQPLNTFKFMAVYPIPRRIWPNKPRSLGYYITNHVLGRTTSWGTGVAGQAKYEGGVIVAAMFGYFAAFWVRFFDDALRRQPTNPFLIAMLAAAGIHLFAWPRGELSVMSFEVVEAVFFTVGLALLTRFLFGTERGGYFAAQGIGNHVIGGRMYAR